MTQIDFTTPIFAEVNENENKDYSEKLTVRSRNLSNDMKTSFSMQFNCMEESD